MQPGPNLRYYPSICLDRLRKTMIKFGHNGQCPGRDLNWTSTGHKSEALLLSFSIDHAHLQ
jgi:hypothetical protein